MLMGLILSFCCFVLIESSIACRLREILEDKIQELIHEGEAGAILYQINVTDACMCRVKMDECI